MRQRKNMNCLMADSGSVGKNGVVSPGVPRPVSVGSPAGENEAYGAAGDVANIATPSGIVKQFERRFPPPFFQFK
jgi:hypothetical protein